jgi:hypothetical protein
MKTVVYLRSPRKTLEQRPQLEIPIHPDSKTGSTTLHLTDPFSPQGDPPSRKAGRILDNDDAGYVDKGRAFLAF